MKGRHSFGSKSRGQTRRIKGYGVSRGGIRL